MQSDDEVGHGGRTQILQKDVFHAFHILLKPEPCLYRDSPDDELFLFIHFNIYIILYTYKYVWGASSILDHIACTKD